MTQSNFSFPLSVSLTVSLCISLHPCDAKIHCYKWGCKDHCCRQGNARASPPVYCYNDLAVKNTSTNSAARTSETASRPHRSHWRHHQIKQQLSCVSPLLPHRPLLDIFSNVPSSLFSVLSCYWQGPPRRLPPNTMHDMVCNSLGWRPISLTSVRQILFDNFLFFFVRASPANPLWRAEIVLVQCSWHYTAKCNKKNIKPIFIYIFLFRGSRKSK